MKLVWERYIGTPLTLYARMLYDHGAVTMSGMTENHLVSVQQWCDENDCGERISYDMFRFRNRAEMTSFLLKWG